MPLNPEQDAVAVWSRFPDTAGLLRAAIPDWEDCPDVILDDLLWTLLEAPDRAPALCAWLADQPDLGHISRVARRYCVGVGKFGVSDWRDFRVAARMPHFPRDLLAAGITVPTLAGWVRTRPVIAERVACWLADHLDTLVELIAATGACEPEFHEWLTGPVLARAPCPPGPCPATERSLAVVPDGDLVAS